MKKIIGIIIVIGIAVGAWLYYQNNSQANDQALWKGYEIQNIKIEGMEYTLVVADTPEHRQQGLMFVRKPTKGFDGMVFRFPDVQSRTFWNKNTYLDLKIYWMIHEEVIGTSDLPSIEKSNGILTVGSPSAVDTVVEIIQ